MPTARQGRFFAGLAFALVALLGLLNAWRISSAAADGRHSYQSGSHGKVA